MILKLLRPTLLLFFVLVSANSHARPPNIVVLLADDLGYGELGCFGGKDIPTPHIDSLAKSGVRLTDGYVTAPFCAASRAGLITGRYQTRFGFEFNPIGPKNEDPKIGLPVGERTIADDLRDAGYVTSLVGKWHLGGTAKFHPQRRGFDEFYGFMHEGHYFVPPPWKGTTTWLRRRILPNGNKGTWMTSDGRIIWSTHMGYHEPDYDANNPILRNSQPIDEQSHLTDAITREAVSFIDRHQEQPFFLLVSYNAVHSPMQGADAYMKKFKQIDDIHRRIFAAMLGHLDDSVGEILAKIRDSELEEETLIVFLSDNGGPTRELTSSNAPLRGEKGWLYEGGIRVPYIVQWKGQLPADKTYSEPVTSLDLAATFRAAANITPNRKRRYDGVNLLPYLSGTVDTPPHETLFWRVGDRHALRQGNWKIVRHSRGDNPNQWELYNLADDIGESDDLAAANEEQLQKLLASWEKLNGEMVEPLW